MPDSPPELKIPLLDVQTPTASPGFARFFKVLLALVAGAGAGAVAARNLGDPLIRGILYILVLAACIGGIVTDRPLPIYDHQNRQIIRPKRRQSGWALLALAVILAMISDATVLVGGFLHFASAQLDGPKNLKPLMKWCEGTSGAEQGQLVHVGVPAERITPHEPGAAWLLSRPDISFRLRKGRGVKWLSLDDIALTVTSLDSRPSGEGAPAPCAPTGFANVAPQIGFAFDLSGRKSGETICPAFVTQDHKITNWRPGCLTVDGDFEVPLTISLNSEQTRWCEVAVVLKVRSDFGLTQSIPLTETPLTVCFYRRDSARGIKPSPPVPSPKPGSPVGLEMDVTPKGTGSGVIDLQTGRYEK
jgi:hypothetical protein